MVDLFFAVVFLHVKCFGQILYMLAVINIYCRVDRATEDAALKDRGSRLAFHIAETLCAGAMQLQQPTSWIMGQHDPNSPAEGERSHSVPTKTTLSSQCRRIC